MTTVYRLTKRRHQSEIFSGRGGLHASGRWTPRGHRVVYTSGSIALAVLEYTLNYKHRGWVPASVIASAEWPDDLKVETVAIDRLPKNWSNAEAPPTVFVRSPPRAHAEALKDDPRFKALLRKANLPEYQFHEFPPR